VSARAANGRSWLPPPRVHWAQRTAALRASPPCAGPPQREAGHLWSVPGAHNMSLSSVPLGAQWKGTPPPITQRYGHPARAMLPPAAPPFSGSLAFTLSALTASQTRREGLSGPPVAFTSLLPGTHTAFTPLREPGSMSVATSLPHPMSFLPQMTSTCPWTWTWTCLWTYHPSPSRIGPSW